MKTYSSVLALVLASTGCANWPPAPTGEYPSGDEYENVHWHELAVPDLLMQPDEIEALPAADLPGHANDAVQVDVTSRAQLAVPDQKVALDTASPKSESSSATPQGIGLMDVVARPAEKALLAGWRAYDDAQYGKAEEHLALALTTGLVSPRDRSSARKLLAFIYCTSQRIKMCETAFLAARKADTDFALSRSEVGHPLWGPVYKRVLP